MMALRTGNITQELIQCETPEQVLEVLERNG
jgi:hypothetical protein